MTKAAPRTKGIDQLPNSVFKKRVFEDKMNESTAKIYKMVKGMFDKDEKAINFTPERVPMARKGMSAHIPVLEKDDPKLEGEIAATTLTQFDLEVEPGVTIIVYVIKPNDLPEKGNPALFYAHMGGIVVHDAADFNNMCRKMALSCKCIVFNVNYRKAPETKCPKNTMDYVTAIRHVYNNADSFGVDNTKMCASGKSGGGCITLATGYVL